MARKSKFIRYRRVYNILRADKLIPLHWGVKQVNICRPDQTSEAFPEGVVRVTDAILAQGYDACNVTVADVLSFAHHLLVKRVNSANITIKSKNSMPKSTVTVTDPDDTIKTMLAERQQQRKTQIAELQRSLQVAQADYDACGTALNALGGAPASAPEKIVKRAVAPLAERAVALVERAKAPFAETTVSAKAELGNTLVKLDNSSFEKFVLRTLVAGPTSWAIIRARWESETGRRSSDASYKGKLYRMDRESALITFNEGMASLRIS